MIRILMIVQNSIQNFSHYQLGYVEIRRSSQIFQLIAKDYSTWDTPTFFNAVLEPRPSEVIIPMPTLWNTSKELYQGCFRYYLNKFLYNYSLFQLRYFYVNFVSRNSSQCAEGSLNNIAKPLTETFFTGLMCMFQGFRMCIV